MHPATCLATVLCIASCFLLLAASATAAAENSHVLEAGASLLSKLDNGDNQVHIREKRTLFLKKKLLGAGLLGFGLGLVKGYKSAYHVAPQVHHVYLSPPSSAPTLKYIEYVERPSPFVGSAIHKISPFHSIHYARVFGKDEFTYHVSKTRGDVVVNQRNPTEWTVLCTDNGKAWFLGKLTHAKRPRSVASIGQYPNSCISLFT